jgi:hypothetical protein
LTLALHAIRAILIDEMADDTTALCKHHEKLEHDRKILFKAWLSWHPSNHAANGYPSQLKLKRHRREAQAKLDDIDGEIARHIQSCELCKETRRP